MIKMTKNVNRKNNCTVHFMVNEEELEELNRRFSLTSYKTKREFYRDSIFKNRIISIDLHGTFKKELRELSTLVSRNASNINQMAKVANSTGSIYGEDLEEMKLALVQELAFMTEFREKVMDYIYNEVVS